VPRDRISAPTFVKDGFWYALPTVQRRRPCQLNGMVVDGGGKRQAANIKAGIFLSARSP